MAFLPCMLWDFHCWLHGSSTFHSFEWSCDFLSSGHDCFFIVHVVVDSPDFCEPVCQNGVCSNQECDCDDFYTGIDCTGS